METIVYENIKYKSGIMPLVFHSDVYTNICKWRTHWHDQPENLFITSGRVKVRMENEVYFAGVGDVVSIGPGELHNVTAETERATAYCMITDKSFFAQYNMPVEKLRLCPVTRVPELVEKAAKIEELLNTQPLYFEAGVAAVMLEIFFVLYGNHTKGEFSGSTAKNSETIKKAVTYIRKNIGRNITVDEIAKHVGYSKYHLCHSFKQLTGSTVVTYINTLKTDQAAKRLEEGNVPVGQVALECGYNDVCYFTKTFKKYKGVSPSEYGRSNEGR